MKEIVENSKRKKNKKRKRKKRKTDIKMKFLWDVYKMGLSRLEKKNTIHSAAC